MHFGITDFCVGPARCRRSRLLVACARAAVPSPKIQAQSRSQIQPASSQSADRSRSQHPCKAKVRQRLRPHLDRPKKTSAYQNLFRVYRAMDHRSLQGKTPRRPRFAGADTSQGVVFPQWICAASRMAPRAAANVLARSRSWCASETNPDSKAEGAKYTPALSIAEKKTRKRGK